MKAHYDQKGDASSVEVNVDRKQAKDFWDLGMKENPDFLRDSMFGQLFRGISMKNSDFSNF